MAKHNSKKVFAAVSGGVDSSVSAALLKDKGYDVTGVFIKVWQPPFLECTWREERRDAMRVCAHLGIPFQTLNLEGEYKKNIVDYMIAEYAAGRTPNPDVLCNRKIKFGAFWKYAQKIGANYIATGHYARIKHSDSHQLLCGADKNKDQSYFLWMLNQDDLSHTLFPIGEIEKPHVRRFARKLDLHTAKKKDSQGLCFVGSVDMKDFLRRFIEVREGNVLNESGVVIGAHSGAVLYTIGERHGFTITKKTPHDRPYYVVAKNIESNTITVSDKSTKKGTFSEVREINIDAVNWIGGEEPDTNKAHKARIRYRQELQNCTIVISKSSTTVVFDESQVAVAPGQSLVLYDGDICIGGGIII